MSSMTQEVGEGNAIVRVEQGEQALMLHAPAIVLGEAQRAARALQDVISTKPRKVMMNGEQYLEFEDWQTVGRFYGITAREDGDPEYVELGAARGFKVSAVAVDRDGRILSRATAYCLDDEEKWSGRTKYAWAYSLRDGGHSFEDPGADNIVWEDNPSKPGKKRPKKERVQVGEERVPLFQLASMAQTRANAKVLRNVLSWVVVLAGYRATPAEELPDGRLSEELEATSREPGSDDGAEERHEHRATRPARTSAPAPASTEPRADVPMVTSKPACPDHGERSVICRANGEWVCATAKGGCGAVLGRVK